MKKIFLIFNLLFIGYYSFSQVGGISASKIGALCTTTVPAQTIEFEPFLQFSSTAHAFDMNGNVRPLFVTTDSVQHSSSAGFRFSYGLFDDFEIGMSIPLDVSEIHVGLKYKLPIEGKTSFGLIAGYNGISGNNLYVKRDAVGETTNSAVGGVVLTSDFTEKFSIDFNAQYQKHFNKTDGGHTGGYFINADAGYYFIENVNFIVGSSYYTLFYDDEKSNVHLFSILPAITIEKAKNFILVMNGQFDLFGQNEYKTSGFGMALTIMLD